MLKTIGYTFKIKLLKVLLKKGIPSTEGSTVSEVGLLLTALCSLGCLYSFGIQRQVSGISTEPKLAKLL